MALFAGWGPTSDKSEEGWLFVPLGEPASDKIKKGWLLVPLGANPSLIPARLEAALSLPPPSQP